MAGLSKPEVKRAAVVLLYVSYMYLTHTTLFLTLLHSSSSLSGAVSADRLIAYRRLSRALLFSPSPTAEPGADRTRYDVS